MMVSLLPACSSDEPPLESLCQFLEDEDNCLQTFAADVGARCGTLSNFPEGSFLSRDQLDICVLTEGGQVLFDPPLNLTEFPLQQVSAKFVTPLGEPCGAVTIGANSFSLSIEPDPGAAGGGSAESREGLVQGGTFSKSTPDARELFDITCPDGKELHRLTEYHLTKCENRRGSFPTVTFESSVGGIDPIAGYVRVALSLTVPEGGSALQTIYYFDCSIPPAPKPCVNGVRDGSETDVDCGGPAQFCATRCQDGAVCIQDSDCESPATCELELGLKKCSENLTP